MSIACMSTSYKDLELSLSQRLVLRKLKYFPISYEKARSHPKYNFLLKYYLVDRSSKDHRNLTINDRGLMYLRYRHKDNLRFWIPIIISVIALLGGYDVYTIPVLSQLLRAVVQAAKTIWESLGAVF